jgi:Chitin binding Peritrophin-A domain
MSKLIFLILVIVSAAFAEPNGTCPPGEDPSTPTFLGDTEDCTVYYTCFVGTALPSVCPEGLEWHATGHYCDFPENSQCSTGPTTSTASSVIESTTTADNIANKPLGVCPPEEDPSTPTFLGDANDCTVYYTCYLGTALPSVCPEGLEWHATGQYCDYPENAQCSMGSSTSTASTPGESSTTSASTTNNPLGVCPPEEDPSTPTFLGDANDCTVYYTCYLGTALPSVCPEGLEWHATGRYCDYPENAQCNLGSATTAAPTSSPTVEITTTPTGAANKPFGVCPPPNEKP